MHREVSFDDKTKITDNNDIITIHYYALKLVKYLWTYSNVWEKCYINMVWNNNNRNKLRLVEYSVYTWFIVMRSLKLMFLTIHIFWRMLLQIYGTKIQDIKPATRKIEDQDVRAKLIENTHRNWVLIASHWPTICISIILILMYKEVLKMQSVSSTDVC